MSKAQHTPGPREIDYGYDKIINSIGPYHPDQYASSSWLRVTEADAVLIAAAPELLEYLQYAVWAHPELEKNEKLMAVITKATAQQ